MISLQELLKSTPFDTLPQDHRFNLTILLKKINVIRQAYGKPMTVTSGYRSMADHLRIYRQKGITDKSKIPMKSNHLSGRAVDIADSNGELKKWVLANVHLLEQTGLWCEDFDYTSGWTHFQTVAPTSGKRFFKP